MDLRADSGQLVRNALEIAGCCLIVCMTYTLIHSRAYIQSYAHTHTHMSVRTYQTWHRAERYATTSKLYTQIKLQL